MDDGEEEYKPTSESMGGMMDEYDILIREMY